MSQSASEPDGAAPGVPRRAVPPAGEPPAGLGRPGEGVPGFLPPSTPQPPDQYRGRPAPAPGAPGPGRSPSQASGTPYGAAGLSSDWLLGEPPAPPPGGYPGPYAPPRQSQPPSPPGGTPTVGVGKVLGFVVGAVALVLVAAYLAWPRPAEQPRVPTPAPSSAVGPSTSPPPTARRSSAATPRGSASPAGSRLQLGDIPAQVGGWQAGELTPGILLYVKGRTSLTVMQLDGTTAESYMRVFTDAPAISSDGRVWCGVPTKIPGMGDGTWCVIQTRRLALISIADPNAAVPGSEVTMLADAIAQKNP